MNQTHQQPSAEAWRAFAARSGDVLDGEVCAIVPFGTFVRFEEGVDGLIPAVEARRELGVGDRVSVRVLQLDAEKRRASLREV